MCKAPDLNPTKDLWGDLKQAEHRRCPYYLMDIECFYKNERSNIIESIFADRLLAKNSEW